MFERKHQKLATRSQFAQRMLSSIAAACALIAFALGIGIFGYRTFANEPWIDALLEASMILGGMGPVNPLTNDGAKLFASFYALFSGLIFVMVMGIVLAPVAHRMLHKFHLDESDLGE